MNWSIQTPAVAGNAAYAVDFTSSTNGWYAGSGTQARTANGGSSWSSQGPPSSATFQDIQFLNSGTGIIVGLTTTSPPGTTNVYTTFNGGGSWNKATLANGWNATGVSMLDANGGWLVGISDAGGIGGVFRSITGGTSWTQQSVGTTSALLAVTAFNVPGEYNGDGFINALDYEKWRSTYRSQTDFAADGNGNGVIDAADYVIWRKAAQAPGVGVVQIPEPSTLLLGVGAFSLLSYRKAKSHG
jgi:hypothetical protein